MVDYLSVLRHGPMMSIQDSGRHGYRSLGVSSSGAMDRGAHAIANALVGNPETAATIEFALTGGAFRASRDVLVAITGGDCRVEIDGEVVPPWESHVVSAGQTLSIGHMHGAVWGYLAISGGVETLPALDSRSTHLRTGIGGHKGSALVSGDQLPLGECNAFSPLSLGQPYFRRPGPILVVRGPQDDYFDDPAWRTFLSQPYQVTASRDRMAMVLEGPRLTAFRGHDIVSDATVCGSIQVPGSGRPIVLTADGQTTGGYPKIATVASCDLGRLVQMPSGTRFMFRSVSADRAEELAIEARRRLAAIVASLSPKTTKRFWE